MLAYKVDMNAIASSRNVKWIDRVDVFVVPNMLHHRGSLMKPGMEKGWLQEYKTYCAPLKDEAPLFPTPNKDIFSIVEDPFEEDLQVYQELYMEQLPREDNVMYDDVQDSRNRPLLVDLWRRDDPLLFLQVFTIFEDLPFPPYIDECTLDLSEMQIGRPTSKERFPEDDCFKCTIM